MPRSPAPIREDNANRRGWRVSSPASPAKTPSAIAQETGLRVVGNHTTR